MEIKEMTTREASAEIATKIAEVQKLLNECKQIAEYHNVSFQYYFDDEYEPWDSSDDWYDSGC